MAEQARNALQWCGIRPGTRALRDERAESGQDGMAAGDAMKDATDALMRHFRKVEHLQMRDLFAGDPQRFDRFSLETGDLLLDYSKNRITSETISLLVRLAEAAGLPEMRLELHVYSTNPQQRFVFINGRKYQQGDSTQEGAAVDEITPDGVILNARGNRFLLPRD
jgi:hypothetical protein